MSRESFRWEVSRDSEGLRLDHEIFRHLSEILPRLGHAPLSRSRIRAILVSGGVYLNRSRVKIASKTVRAGATIEVWVDFGALPEASKEPAFRLRESEILYRDSHLIAVHKPAGLPTQPTVDDSRSNLFQSIKDFLKGEGNPNPYVGLHHRLDRDTSGVVLFTLKEEANAGVSALFSSKSKGEESSLNKIYLALCERNLTRKAGDAFTVKNFLGLGSPRGKIKRYTSVRSGGDPAITHFRILAQCKEATFIEARPVTGRTHQIRVHLHEEGLSILGDRIYSDSLPTGTKERLFLHAHRLGFLHPITERRIEITAPLPQDFRERLEKYGVLDVVQEKPNDLASAVEIPPNRNRGSRGSPDRGSSGTGSSDPH